jgi:ADP-dependent phosphofructokinase/glucokinase
MKKLVLGLIVLVVAACSGEPFKANIDNELLVGQWKITEVDDADALLSKEEFITSIIHEKYKVGYVFNFEKGANFTINSESGEKVLTGQYSIGAENKSLTILVTPENNEFEYELVKNSDTYKLNIQTPGEIVNLSIAKSNLNKHID